MTPIISDGDSLVNHASGEARFVILRHTLPPDTGRSSHWDWMFQRNDRLVTWAVEELPRQQPVSAARLVDHRLAYLEYEGEVSGNRGRVRRIDQGVYRVVCWTDRSIALEMAGRVWRGTAVFQSDDGFCWRLSFSQSRNESMRRVRP